MTSPSTNTRELSILKFYIRLGRLPLSTLESNETVGAILSKYPGKRTTEKENQSLLNATKAHAGKPVKRKESPLVEEISVMDIKGVRKHIQRIQKYVNDDEFITIPKGTGSRPIKSKKQTVLHPNQPLALPAKRSVSILPTEESKAALQVSVLKCKAENQVNVEPGIYRGKELQDTLDNGANAAGCLRSKVPDSKSPLPVDMDEKENSQDRLHQNEVQIVLEGIIQTLSSYDADKADTASHDEPQAWLREKSGIEVTNDLLNQSELGEISQVQLRDSDFNNEVQAAMEGILQALVSNNHPDRNWDGSQRLLQGDSCGEMPDNLLCQNEHEENYRSVSGENIQDAVQSAMEDVIQAIQSYNPSNVAEVENKTRLESQALFRKAACDDVHNAHLDENVPQNSSRAHLRTIPLEKESQNLRASLHSERKLNESENLLHEVSQAVVSVALYENSLEKYSQATLGRKGPSQPRMLENNRDNRKTNRTPSDCTKNGDLSQKKSEEVAIVPMYDIKYPAAFRENSLDENIQASSKTLDSSSEEEMHETSRRTFHNIDFKASWSGTQFQKEGPKPPTWGMFHDGDFKASIWGNIPAFNQDLRFDNGPTRGNFQETESRAKLLGNTSWGSMPWGNVWENHSQVQNEESQHFFEEPTSQTWSFDTELQEEEEEIELCDIPIEGSHNSMHENVSKENSESPLLQTVAQEVLQTTTQEASPQAVVCTEEDWGTTLQFLEGDIQTPSTELAYEEGVKAKKLFTTKLWQAISRRMPNLRRTKRLVENFVRPWNRTWFFRKRTKVTCAKVSPSEECLRSCCDSVQEEDIKTMHHDKPREEVDQASTCQGTIVLQDWLRDNTREQIKLSEQAQREDCEARLSKQEQESDPQTPPIDNKGDSATFIGTKDEILTSTDEFNIDEVDLNSSGFYSPTQGRRRRR